MRADPPPFIWAVGEEGSDPIVMKEGVAYRHDQYESSRHYYHQDDDLTAIADLGVRIVRYGMPWRLAEPAPGTYDWTLWDRAFLACHRAGLEPIVDLLHFGLPHHCGRLIEGRWVEAFGRYVDAFLDRYRTVMWFTPVNEPGITAKFSGLYGWWNDRSHSEEDFARILGFVTLANLEAMARVRADRGGWWIGSEGFDIVVPAEAEEQKARRRRALNWLVWDLHFGVEPLPLARGLLDAIDDPVRDRIAALVSRERVIAGHDIYPISIGPTSGPRPEWTVPELVALYLDEARRWHDRYQVPFWVSETSNLGLPVTAQTEWLGGLLGGLDTLAAEGRPVRGLCWYSRGDQFDWDTALVEPTGAVTEVGLFDATRHARQVAAAFAERVARR